MGIRIATNTAADSVERNLSLTTQKQRTSIQKLASGSRINTASDDAAGLSISEKLKAGIRSLQQASRNSNDGISLIQTAEGGISEINNIMIRLRELSVQAASDTIGDPERNLLNKEFQQMKQEINHIANATVYNGRDLLNGKGSTLEFQVGIDNNTFADRLYYSPQEMNMTMEALSISGASIESKTGAQENLSRLDNATQKINFFRAKLGGLQSSLASNILNTNIGRENLSASNSRIRDTDIAEASSDAMKEKILENAGTMVLSQATKSPEAALRLLS